MISLRAALFTLFMLQNLYGFLYEKGMREKSQTLFLYRINSQFNMHFEATVSIFLISFYRNIIEICDLHHWKLEKNLHRAAIAEFSILAHL